MGTAIYSITMRTFCTGKLSHVYFFKSDSLYSYNLEKVAHHRKIFIWPMHLRSSHFENKPISNLICCQKIIFIGSAFKENDH